MTVEDDRLRACIVSVQRLQGVRAGSALLRMGNRLLAVQDDAWSVAWISLPDLTVSLRPLKGGGAALPKMQKPDFEAAITTPDHRIHLLGSGSRANRCAVACLAADDDLVTVVERPLLYQNIQQALHLPSRPNIEAAVMHQGQLRLFHRGSGASPSGSVDLALSALDGDPAAILASRNYAFGQIGGVALHITDAASLGPSRTAFVAAAEQTDDAVTDGPVAGSVVGIIEPVSAGSRIRWTRLLEADGRPTLRKVEGLALDDDGGGAWLLTDPDSAERPAELCRVRLQGFN